MAPFYYPLRLTRLVLDDVKCLFSQGALLQEMPSQLWALLQDALAREAGLGVELEEISGREAFYKDLSEAANAKVQQLQNQLSTLQAELSPLQQAQVEEAQQLQAQAEGQVLLLGRRMRSLRDELRAAQALLEAEKHQTELGNNAKLQLEASCSQTTSDLRSKADKANALAEELQNEMALLKIELTAEKKRSCSVAEDFEATKGQAALLDEQVRSLRDEVIAVQASLQIQRQETEAAKKFKVQLQTVFTPVTLDPERQADTANKSAEELRSQVASLKIELAREQALVAVLSAKLDKMSMDVYEAHQKVRSQRVEQDNHRQAMKQLVSMQGLPEDLDEAHQRLSAHIQEQATHCQQIQDMRAIMKESEDEMWQMLAYQSSQTLQWQVQARRMHPTSSETHVLLEGTLQVQQELDANMVAQGAAEDKVKQLKAQLQATKLSAKESQMIKASQTTLPAVELKMANQTAAGQHVDDAPHSIAKNTSQDMPCGVAKGVQDSCGAADLADESSSSSSSTLYKPLQQPSEHADMAQQGGTQMDPLEYPPGFGNPQARSSVTSSSISEQRTKTLRQEDQSIAQRQQSGSSVRQIHISTPNSNQQGEVNTTQATHKGDVQVKWGHDSVDGQQSNGVGNGNRQDGGKQQRGGRAGGQAQRKRGLRNQRGDNNRGGQGTNAGLVTRG